MLEIEPRNLLIKVHSKAVAWTVNSECPSPTLCTVSCALPHSHSNDIWKPGPHPGLTHPSRAMPAPVKLHCPPPLSPDMLVVGMDVAGSALSCPVPQVQDLLVPP